MQAQAHPERARRHARSNTSLSKARSARANPRSPSGCATRLDATAVLEETENPFLADFYAGRAGAALQTQLFYLLNRHRQQLTLRQADLFSQSTVCDYLFDRDKIFAYLNLDDNELFIYQRLFDLLSKDVPAPDLVIYLQAPTDVLAARLRDRARDPEHDAPIPGDDYLRELNEAYQHFFFHYSATPLLVVETSQIDLQSSDEALDDLDSADQDDEERNALLRAEERGSGLACTMALDRAKVGPDGVVQEGPETDRLGDRGEAEPGS